jgi:hypothetical protein
MGAYVSPLSANFKIGIMLANRPRIARFVRSFNLCISSKYPVFHSLYRALARAIFYMSDLRYLDLCIDSGTSWVLTATSKSQSYPHLLRLECPFDLDHHVTSFLAATPELIELKVASIPNALSAPLVLFLKMYSIVGRL